MRKRPLVGASAVVERGDGAVALIKRLWEPGTGLWALPGGFIEYGEPVRETARREVEEEIGLKVEIGDLIGVYDIIKRSPEGGVVYHFITICYRARVLGNSFELKPGEDVGGARWFMPSEISPDIVTDTTWQALCDIGLVRC